MARWHIPGVVAMVVLSGTVSLRDLPQTASATTARADIVANDNRTPAGVLRDGVLSLDLVAGAGRWFPERGEGPAHEVYAFGEAGHALQIPGPLVRVPAGTEIHATIRNTLDAPLVVHGLHDRPGAATTSTISAGTTSSVRFRVTRPGTFLYWGTTRGARVLRDRFGMESQLLGALIVDSAGSVPADHVFVISVEDDSAQVPADRALRAATVNGLSWPHSAMVDVPVGDTVRMRWINASDRPHPIHLHGFYFRVDSRGDIVQDTIYDAARTRLVATEHMLQGETMGVTWVPDRPGNWLMHCHMALHMSPVLRRGAQRAHPVQGHTTNHTLDVMAGLVTGWRILPRGASANASPGTAAPERRLRLLVQSAPRPGGGDPVLGFVLQTGDAAPRADSVVVPGPPLVLTRGEPVQITVVNLLDAATSIHWHGIELDSYFDGVSGWSGAGSMLAPSIAARDSFIVRFTPPRAGTFIYHSHFDEERQLASGVYGPLIVLEPGEKYDPVTDLTWVLGATSSAERIPPTMVNGSAAPTLELEAGQRYRIRVVNIQPNVSVTLSLLADSVPIRWRALAKDGADLPAHQVNMVPAVVRIAVGETYDFELVPETAGELRLRITDLLGSVVRVNGVVRVRPRRN